MKYVLSTASAIFLLSACNNNTATQVAEEETNSKPQLTVAMLSTPHDYVCGMDLEKDEFVADTTLYNGKIYGFCAHECKVEFAKNPEQYLTQN